MCREVGRHTAISAGRGYREVGVHADTHGAWALCRRHPILAALSWMRAAVRKDWTSWLQHMTSYGVLACIGAAAAPWHCCRCGAVADVALA